MITIYEQIGRFFYKTDEYKDKCWIDVTSPTNNEIEELRQRFSIPADLINDTIDIDERARVENDEGWNLFVIRIPIPVTTEKRSTQMYTVPLSILTSTNVIITVCLHQNQITNSPALFKMDEFQLDRPLNFVLCLMMQTAQKYIDYLRIINRQSDNISKSIHVSTTNSELIMLLRLEKGLVYFITSLKSNDALLAKIRRSRYVDTSELDEDLLEDVMVEMRQATEIANIHSDILGSMMEVQAGLISNNLNDVMKVLTTMSILLMIPTLVASFFGMNLISGLENSPHAFIYALIISVVLSGFAWWQFKRKKWF